MEQTTNETGIGRTGTDIIEGSCSWLMDRGYSPTEVVELLTETIKKLTKDLDYCPVCKCDKSPK